MALFSGYQSPEGMGELSKLLDKGGLASMLNTIFLILTAMTFGGMLDSTGILRQLLDQVLRGVKRTGDLILATVGVASSPTYWLPISFSLSRCPAACLRRPTMTAG